ncbi:BA14K family protein [Chelativorans sp. Marseille-P2723]|uniref:BA14K family protein n=1 Tax=Chelativorans sp. Marseille-P2723 TaxID=2709133 RepID=UPI00156F345C|nr:BA14K family protein [Chelativorans sp. Marseille-P2723]
MKRILKSAVLGVAVAATTLSAIPAAQADHHWRRYHRHHSSDTFAAGIAGLALGAIVGGALTQPRYYYPNPVYAAPPVYAPPVYAPPIYAPFPRYHYRPAPVYRSTVTYYGALEPWSPGWYRACSARFRSFDPASGTYLGYDGRRHFCNIR